MTTIEHTDVSTQHKVTTDDQQTVVAPAPKAEKTKFLNRRGVKPVIGFVVPVVLLFAWWAATAAEVFTPVQLPSPSAVIDATVGLIQRGDLWTHIGISVQRVLIGFGIGAVLGMIFGAVLGLSR